MLKTLFKIKVILAISALCICSKAYGQEMTILFHPYMYLGDEQPELDIGKMDEVVEQYIEKSPKFRLKQWDILFEENIGFTPDEFYKKNREGSLGDYVIPDEAEPIISLDMIRGSFIEINAGFMDLPREFLFPDNIYTMLEVHNSFKIDLYWISFIYKIPDHDLYRVGAEVLSLDNGLFYNMSSDCSFLEIKNVIGEQTKTLLEKAGDVARVKADRIIDPVESIVGFDVPTADGEVIQIKIDYTSRRPGPDLETMTVLPPEVDGVEGKRNFLIPTREGKDIQYSVKYNSAGEAILQKFDTPMPANAADGHVEEVLSVDTQGGYVLEFKYVWDNQKLSAFECKPLVNPYSV